MRKQERSILCAVLIFLFAASSALAEDTPPRTFELDAEYRVRNMHLRPWELSGTEIGSATWTQQRLRVDAITRQEGVGAIILQLDILDGVIFGDNGAFGKDPSSISGVSLAAKRPNNTIWEMGLMPGKDPLDRCSTAEHVDIGKRIYSLHLQLANRFGADPAIRAIGMCVELAFQPVNRRVAFRAAAQRRAGILGEIKVAVDGTEISQSTILYCRLCLDKGRKIIAVPDQARNTVAFDSVN